MSAEDKAYIIILNWNNWRDTIECLESVFQSSYANFQVVAVDNGSTDGSEEKIIAWAEGKQAVESRFFRYKKENKPIPLIRYDRPTAEAGGNIEQEKASYPSMTVMLSHPLILIQTGADLGYAGGNNVGIRYAMKKNDSSLIWILNNDTAVERDALIEMVRCARTDEQVGIVGSKLLYHDMPERLQATGGGKITSWLGNVSYIGGQEHDSGQYDIPSEIDFVTGASLLVKKAVLNDIGLFEESYFLGWEDIDLNKRAGIKGYRILYCPGSKVWHKEGGTLGRVTPSQDYYWTRNGLVFARKFYPWFLPFVMASYIAKYTIIRTLKGLPRNLIAVTRGFMDFFRGKSGEA